ncbi:MAG: phosphoenolpyruvate--protein phosphotransferase [Prevotella sp.]|jgi:phosphotransferase system enzyme I (PtsI)|nr:phosphoenolpyruvate--protein phosphotransferase [Prevotella sp.]
MKEIKGMPVSSEKAVGRVFRAKTQPALTMGNYITDLLPEHETCRFHNACLSVKNKLAPHAKDNEIFAAHMEILEDISERVASMIGHEKTDAVSAVDKCCTEICTMFADIDDEHLRSRSDDIVDVCRQITLVLTEKDENPFSEMPENSIIIAENLLASDTISIDLSKLSGIALKKGSKTSHLAILAKSNAIPLILGAGDELDTIQNGDTIVIDSEKGVIITEPDEKLLSEIAQQRVYKDEADSNPAITKDNIEIAVYANAGSLADVKRAISAGADGVGLLRTEFIFMQGKDFPSEEEQYNFYSECAKNCRGKTLTIRTLDIGADKQLPYYTMPVEENPVMGLRGIRFSLSSPDIFKTQLRAILRAAVSGNIRIMFPMITSMEEYKQACAFLEVCKTELKDKNINFDQSLHAGIMIETPASVLLADEFASEVAFFSIGTNDLTQYMLAVDRNAPYSAGACDSLHPAMKKSISDVVASADKYGIDVSVCGEVASDSHATELLLKLGVKKLSITSSGIPAIKRQIRKQSIN